MTLARLREVPPGDGFATCPGCGIALAPNALTGYTFRGPHDIYPHVAFLGALEREELWVVLADTKNRVIATERVYQGNVSSNLVRVGEIFREAVRIGAANLVIVHNHPSGDPTPSPDDLHMTAECLRAGELLDINVRDHLVIGRDSFVSLRDRGVAFDR